MAGAQVIAMLRRLDIEHTLNTFPLPRQEVTRGQPGLAADSAR